MKHAAMRPDGLGFLFQAPALQSHTPTRSWPLSGVSGGERWARLGIEALEVLTGAGVFYGAAVTEGRGDDRRACVRCGRWQLRRTVAVYLARFAQHVTLLVRGPSLADSMSDYLSRELGNQAHIDIRYRTEVVDGHGDARAGAATVRDRDSGETGTVSASALFVFIGGAPRADWLPDEIARGR